MRLALAPTLSLLSGLGFALPQQAIDLPEPPDAGQAQEIAPPTHLHFESVSEQQVHLDLDIDGRPQSFLLERLRVRGDGYRLLLDVGLGKLEAVPPGRTGVYRGVSFDGRHRALFAWDGQRARGSVRDLLTGRRFDYDATDSDRFPAQTLVSQAARPEASSAMSYAGTGPDTAPLGRIELAADADYERYEELGFDAELVEFFVLAVVGFMNDEHWNDPFESDDPRLEIQVPYLVIRTTPNDPYDGTTTNETILDMLEEWSGPLSFLGNDVVHLFSGKQHTNSSIGTAYLNGACQTNGLGFLEQSQPSLSEVADEHTWLLGIGLGVTGCFGSTTGCDLMCTNDNCDNDNTGFGPAKLAEIEAAAQSKSCITMLPGGTSNQPPDVTSVLFPGVPAVVPGTSNQLLLGTNFSSVSEITVGGVVLDPLDGDFEIPSDTQIRLNLPELPSLGPQTVVVSNTAGSDTATININPNTSPALELVDSLPRVLDGSGMAQIYVGSQPGDIVLLYASDSQLPSTLPGIVDLSIGDNFTLLADLGIFIVDASTGYVDYSAPLGQVETGVQLYVQAVVLSPDLALPATVTNVETGYVL